MNKIFFKSIVFFLMILTLLSTALLLGCQKKSSNFQTFEIKLSAQVPNDSTKLRWSPKGEKLTLTPDNSGLETKLHLGAKDSKPFFIRLERNNNKKYFDTLIIDTNRDGSFADEKPVTTIPNTVRGKVWSSFNAVLNIPVIDPYDNKASTNSYPISFWYVEDPKAENKKPILRFSRRGWMFGKTDIDGVEASVLLTEMKMDGIFDRFDRWALSSSGEIQNLYLSKSAHSVSEHAWLGGQAFRVKEVHQSGRKIVLEKIDPGITRQEEEKQKDLLAADRNAPHSGGVVAFGHDFKTAEELSRKNNKTLFIDFETTWCGPCKTMDKLVYTADEVVAASKNVIAVKIDGDEHPELVKRFKVEAYPTMLLVAADGKILKRAVGYQSVKVMSAFLK